MNERTYRNDRLVALREERGLKQVDAAQELGISQSYVSMLERGKVASPGIDRLSHIAKYYDVHLDYILGKTDNRRPYEDRIDLEQLSPGEQTMIELFRKLSEADQARLLDMGEWIESIFRKRA
jgi:transcriptional regulator with XRE-family HTH domain